MRIKIHKNVFSDELLAATNMKPSKFTYENQTPNHYKENANLTSPQ